MSSLAPYIRKRLAIRRIVAVIDNHAFGAEMDAGFDGGEFSGPAHGRMEHREIIDICAALRVSADYAMTAAQYYDDPDPMGTWHGKDE